MTKASLISEVAAGAQLTKKQAEDAVGAVSASILESLKNGGEAVFPGLGKFLVKDRPARKGKNLHTGEPIDIPAGKRVVFRPAKSLKGAVK